MDRAMGFIDLKDVYLNALLRAADIASTPVEQEGDVALAGSRSAAAPARPGWLETEILREYQQIQAAARSDTFKPYSNDEFEQAVQDLLTFARERSTSVKDQVHTVRR